MAVCWSSWASVGDTNGFQQPFAALVLSEVARTDRIDPWMTPAMRSELVTAAATYLAGGQGLPRVF